MLSHSSSRKYCVPRVSLGSTDLFLPIHHWASMSLSAPTQLPPSTGILYVCLIVRVQSMIAQIDYVSEYIYIYI